MILESKYNQILEQTKRKPILTVDDYGTKYWTLKGIPHRLDGPAVEHKDGRKEWWVNGIRHRTDGPAVIWSNGSKAWYVNGKLHRLDGPAYEGPKGYKEWWINNIDYTKEEYDAQRILMKTSEALGIDLDI